jgi:hypothetical protein
MIITDDKKNKHSSFHAYEFFEATGATGSFVRVEIHAYGKDAREARRFFEQQKNSFASICSARFATRTIGGLVDGATIQAT